VHFVAGRWRRAEIPFSGVLEKVAGDCRPDDRPDALRLRAALPLRNRRQPRFGSRPRHVTLRRSRIAWRRRGPRRRRRSASERADLDARLAAAAAFEAWLSDERQGQAKGAMPDPIPLVERTETADETDLRNQLASLSAALTRAKAREEELKASKVDVARLNEQLSAGSSETQRLRDDAGARIPVGQRVASNALRRGFVPCCLTMI